MTRRKLFLPVSLITLGTALGVTGCGTVQATIQTQVHGAETSGSAPIDAALITPGFGWVLTVDRLLVTRDGGVTFSDAKAPVPVTTTRAAFFRDTQNGYVTASTGNTITTAHTSDGGRTWQTGTVRDAAAPAAEYGRLRMTFGDADHGVIVSQTSASAMSSSATLFATEDGGASWSARSAPTAGEVAMEPDGRTWLAGGVVGDELHFSTDQGRHWSSATLHVDGAVDTEAVAPPIDGVVPVTVVTKTDQTEVALLTSADKGRTWRETNRVAVRGRTGPNVRVPVAVTGTGPLVLDTAGGHAYRVPVHRSAATTAAAPDLRPAGLPEGANAVTFASDRRTGWALAAYGRCANGKSNCTLYHPLLTTTDGGGTWRQVQLWQQKLN
jgi:hypothetical protein